MGSWATSGSEVHCSGSWKKFQNQALNYQGKTEAGDNSKSCQWHWTDEVYMYGINMYAFLYTQILWKHMLEVEIISSRRVFQDTDFVLNSKGCIFVTGRIWSLISSLLSVYQSKSYLFCLCLSARPVVILISILFFPTHLEWEVWWSTLLHFLPGETVMKTRNTNVQDSFWHVVFMSSLRAGNCKLPPASTV